MRAKCAVRAAMKGTAPPTARCVSSDRASSTPQNLASLPISSSLMIALPTSKRTAQLNRKASATLNGRPFLKEFSSFLQGWVSRK